MADQERTLIDPLKELTTVVADEQFVGAHMAGRINALSALLADLGNRMNEELRRRWIDRMAEAVSACHANTCGLSPDIQRLSTCAVRALEGRFHAVVEEDYLKAVACYEEAAEAADFVPSELLERTRVLLGGALAEWSRGPVPDNESPVWRQIPEHARALTMWLSRLPAAMLWDWAGDAYCRVDGRMPDARSCYEKGLVILRAAQGEGAQDEHWRSCLCHVELSLANLLLAHSDEWERAEGLYRDVADAVFFERPERKHGEYHDICSLIVPVDSVADATFPEAVWAPHVTAAPPREHQERFANLQAELGERALETLRQEFQENAAGFPVPETYYLVAFLGELYVELKDYGKCANILGRGTAFDFGFFDWTYDELHEASEWAFPFVVHTGTSTLPEGWSNVQITENSLNNSKRPKKATKGRSGDRYA
jgi:hypothetical protein